VTHVHSVDVSGGTVSFAAVGTGPGLLLPWLNFPWLDTPWVDALAQHFTVVVAAPRGYAHSSRLPASATYSVEMLHDDLLAITDRAGVDRFSMLGYSLSGAVAAWLATVEDRVERVVAGGFPLLGPYASVLEGARRDAAASTAAPPLDWGFDHRAALAFYAHLGTLPDGALVERRRATLGAYWGSNDEVLARFGGLTLLEGGLRQRGVPFRVLDGLDHTAALLAFDEVLPWMLRQLRGAP
jgi:pimeloyl-ACP methyl ester carboxylesterase